MSVWTVILIIAVIAAIILGVLYFVGRKMQAKQEDQRAQLDQMAQTVNMLVIDKKRDVYKRQGLCSHPSQESYSLLLILSSFLQLPLVPTVFRLLLLLSGSHMADVS